MHCSPRKAICQAPTGDYNQASNASLTGDFVLLKRWQLWIGLIVSAVCLYIALRNLDLIEVWQTATDQPVRYLWLVPGVLVYFAGVWARTWRWDYMLRPMKQVPLRRLFPIVVIGYMGNNVYPARAGELIRAYVLRRREGVSVSAALATVIVERVFDGLVMLLFVFIGLPFFPSIPSDLQWTISLASLLFIGALLVFIVMAVRVEWAERVSGWFIQRLVPVRFRTPALGFVQRFLTGLHSLRSGRAVLMIFVTSIVIWLAETIKYWFVMHAFDFSVPFYVLMLMNGIVNLATTVPSAPGYVGTFDAPGIAILVAFLGKDYQNVAASYTLVLHAALWLPITLLGFYYMARYGISWRDFGQAARVDEGGRA